MTRLPDWETRLHAALITRTSTHFEWGTHDCALFACDCVLAMTGVDIADWFRGKYRSRNGALRIMRKFTGGYGLDSLAEKIAAQHRIHEVKMTEAKRGDIVLVDANGPTLGIVSLDGIRGYAASPQGLTEFRVLSARRAWSI